MTDTARMPAQTAPRQGVLALLRPRQWAKNVLVLGAPGAAGVLLDVAVLARVGVVLVAFCLLSSAMYVVNDAVDLAADRAHPTKRHRPLASGAVPVRPALALAAVLAAVALGLASAVGPQTLVVLVVYTVNTLTYCLWLKRQPVLELAAVAAGFVLRAVAGAVAAQVPVSEWFLIVACFGALFVVAGKRHGELVRLEGVTGTRDVLASYTVAYLRGVWLISLGVTTTAYCLWAFEEGRSAAYPVVYQLSVLPFVLALLRYALLLEQGRGGEPEDVVLRDRQLVGLGLLWVLVFGVGVGLT